MIIAFYIAIPVQYILLGYEEIGLFSLFIPVYLFLTLPVVMALAKDTDRFLDRVAKVQWGIMLAIFCVSHAPAIATLNLTRFNSSGLLLMLYFLLVLYFADLFQIMASAIWGGKPTWSNQYKTYKGIIIGSIGALIMGSALFWMTPFRAWQAPLMSLLIIVSGTLGALVMSSVKRSLGAVRLDTSMMLTRGALDRMEMLFFSAPDFLPLNNLPFHEINSEKSFVRTKKNTVNYSSYLFTSKYQKMFASKFYFYGFYFPSAAEGRAVTARI